MGDLPPRQRSMRATFDYSWALLTEPEQRQLETLRAWRPDDQNIHAAVLWAAGQADAGSLLSALHPLQNYFMLAGRVYDAMKLYKEALRALPPGDSTFSDTVDDVTFVRATLLNHLQDIGFDRDEQGQPIDIDRLYAYFRARGAKLAEALVCQHLAHRAMREQNVQQALAYFRTQNDPRDKTIAEAFASLISATQGRYETVNLPALAEKEGVLNIGPIGVALTAYGLGDADRAARTVVRAWSVPIALRWPAVLLQYVPVVAALCADGGEFARAAALLAMARNHPGCPVGWWQHIALVQEMDARLQAALSPEEVAAAQALGREMDVGETAVALLEELKAMASPVPTPE